MPMLKCVLSVEKVKRTAGGSLTTKPKDRPICYSTHKDAAIYAYYASLLNQDYEKALSSRKLSSVVTAFRHDAGKCNINFAKEAFDWIRAQGSCVALAFDIKSFFDNLDHRNLKRQWANVLGQQTLPDDHYSVFKSLTRFAWVERVKALMALGISKHNPRAQQRRRLCSPQDFRQIICGQGLVERNRNLFGIPQGSPMSSVLSNIYMLDFDSAVNDKVSSVGGLYRRYCDDMLCIVPPQHEAEIEAFVTAEIKKVKLEIQAAKTSRHHFNATHDLAYEDKPLQYLGFLFDGKRVLLRNAGLGRHYAKMRAAVRLAAATKRKIDKRQPPTKESPNPIKRKKLNIRFSYHGQRNFVSYAFKAAKVFEDPAIKKQVRRHWKKLNATVTKAEKPSFSGL